MIRVLCARPVLFLAVLAALLAPGCSDDEGSRPATEKEPRGGISGQSRCKTDGGKTASGFDCLLYSYDGAGVLSLQHRDAAFNCCAGEITAEISVERRVIRIEEWETPGNGYPCRCLCLYDVDYEFQDLPPGPYQIVVVEPYLQEADEPLSFTINLASTPSDTLCVARDHYPWGGRDGSRTRSPSSPPAR